MLGVLTYFQALLGRRGFIVALIIVALAPLVWEYSGAFTGYFNAYIQRQLAAVSEEKAKGEADKAAEDARSAKAAADNAERLRVAEAEERVQLAKKAAADAETARAAADNAARLKIAEANERTELAKKAAADAETARAAADNAAALKLAEANERAHLAEKAAEDAKTAAAIAENSRERQQAEARKATAEANYQEWLNGVLTGKVAPGWSREVDRRAGTMPRALGGNTGDIVRSLEGAGGISDPFAAGPARRSSAANETPATAQQLSPECRQHFTEWQGFTSHAAFAVLDDGDCRWNGIGNRLNHRSPDEAVAAMKDYCNKKHLACTIIATK